MFELNKIYCMDCLEGMKQIPDKSIDLVLTDPPYGSSYCKWDNIIPFKDMWCQLNRIIKSNGSIILFSSQPFTTHLISSNIKDFRYCLVWNKIRSAGFLNANKMPLKQHEDICVFYKKQPTYNPQKYKDKPYNKTKYNGNKLNKNVIGSYISKSLKNVGDRFPKSILTFSQNWSRQQQLHPTQKPVDLMAYLIKMYSNNNDVILDFTIGSGTTAVACKHLGRNFIGFELCQEYVDIANKRLCQETLVSSGLF